MSGKLAQIVEEMRNMTPEERQQLRRALDELGTPPAQKTREEQYLELLLREGLLERIPARTADLGAYSKRRLIKVKGKPISETIIEERR